MNSHSTHIYIDSNIFNSLYVCIRRWILSNPVRISILDRFSNFAPHFHEHSNASDCCSAGDIHDYPYKSIAYNVFWVSSQQTFDVFVCAEFHQPFEFTAQFLMIWLYDHCSFSTRAVKGNDFKFKLITVRIIHYNCEWLNIDKFIGFTYQIEHLQSEHILKAWHIHESVCKRYTQIGVFLICFCLFCIPIGGISKAFDWYRSHFRFDVNSINSMFIAIMAVHS